MCYSFPVEFNAARPGRRKLSISPAGSGLVLFRTNTATIYTIANAGAMLGIGHKRSMEQTALAAEPGCAADSNSDELGLKHRPDHTLHEFQAHTTTPQGVAAAKN